MDRGSWIHGVLSVPGEGVLAPRVPLDGVGGVLQQVGRPLGREAVLIGGRRRRRHGQSGEEWMLHEGPLQNGDAVLEVGSSLNVGFVIGIFQIFETGSLLLKPIVRVHFVTSCSL